MEVESSKSVSKYDMETDISKLEAPTFTTIDRSNPSSMLTLDWDHQVNLVGKKVLNPMIHSCDKCLKPILIYGRMIPCKHVFCLSCAKEEERTAVCPRCNDKVVRVEQAGLGNIFLCAAGGSRYGNNGCRRTYLSARDLQAHIAHRHSDKKAADKSEKSSKGFAEENLRNVVNSISKASLASVVAAVNNAASSYSNYTSNISSVTTVSSSYSDTGTGGMNISVLNSRPSGTMIPAEPGYTATAAGQSSSYSYAGQPAAAAVTYPNLSQPPPSYSYTGAYAGPGGGGTYAGTGGYQYTGTSGYPAPAAGQPAGSAYTAAAGQPTAGYGTAAAGSYAAGHWTRPPPSAQQTGYYRR